MKNLFNYFNFLDSIYGKNPYKDAGIDICHSLLLFGIIVAKKPKNILELGIGTGVGSETILNALKYNQQNYTYDALDNLYDLGGNLSQTYLDNLKQNNVNIIVSDEKPYVEKCENNKYDLIISDADHLNAGEWVDHIIRICKNNGIIFCHDVANEGYPSLKKYIDYVKNNSIPHYLFNSSSRPDEKCERGWLMIINKK